MNTLKPLFLIILGSLLFNANYAQCPVGETEITIQFIEDGNYPSEVLWDYKIQGELSGSGPYIITDIITACVPEGDLTIVGCDTFGDTWNGAIFQVSITEDGNINNCSSQNGCHLYESTVEDANIVPGCNGNPQYEVTSISIGTCGEIEAITTGCTNSNAINYNACAITDDGSCIIPAENNNCEEAILIDVLDNDCTEYIYEYYNPNGSIDILKDCHNFLGVNTVNHDGFYKIIVPSSGQFRFLTQYYDALSLYNNCNDEPIFCGAVNHFTNLTPGDTLILQISNMSYRERKIEFCLQATEPTDNSNCADAETINVQNNKECIDENFILLEKFDNNPVDITPTCNEDARNDAYYQFVTPTSGSIKINNYGDFGLALFNSCFEEPIFCEKNAAQNIITNLEVGDTLLLQIFDYNRNTDFSFCIEEAIPTTNNDCLNPTFIDILEENEITQSHTYNDLNINSACLENINADSFFSFVVPNSGQVMYNHNFWSSLQIALYTSCTTEPILCERVNSSFLFRNLIPGDTLLLQIASQYFSEDIRFTLRDTPPTENNDCSNAKFIDVATTENYFISPDTLFLRYNTKNIQPTCFDSNFDNFDAFYKFIVPPSGNVSFSKNNEYAGISVFESCNQNSIFCESQAYGNIEINNLTPGDTLILQVYAQYNWVDYIYFQLEEIAPSLNNACTNASPINVAASGECITNEVDLTLKYNSPNVISSCNENSNPDAFYEFVVPPSGSIKIENSQYVGLALYKSCNGLVIYCNQDFNNQIINDLIPGETLILQFFERYDSNRFSFCLEEVSPSKNNNCFNATPITVAESGNCQIQQVTLNNLNYNTSNIHPSCDSRVLFDAFYEFVVPQAGQISFSASERVGMAIYHSCNSNSLFCEDNAQNETIRNLPAGDTLILQIFEDSGQPDFTFCLEEVVPNLNNLCVNAEPYIVNEPGACEGNYIQVSNTSNNTDINPYCTSFVMADVFYSFIVPASGNINISTSESYQHGIAIYDDCLEQSFYCNDRFTNQVVKDLNPGDTLVLQIFQTNPFDFELCLEDAPATLNNNCADATSLQIYNEGACEGNYTSTSLKNNSVSINPSCKYIAADIFYKVTVPENGQFKILSDNYSFGLSIYTACDTNSLLCKSNLNENLIQGLPGNEEVLLQFFQDGTPNDFEFCLEDAPTSVNNNCIDAISIEVFNQSECEGNFITAPLSNNSVNTNPSCKSTTADIFYKVLVPESGQFRITGNLANIGFSIYNACDTNSILCTSNIYNNLITDLPPNEEVILQFFEDNIPYNFEFCIESAIPTINNDCVNAIPIDVAPPDALFEKTDSINFINNSSNINPICTSINQDAFYSFTVPQNGKIAFYTNNNLGVAIYNECNGESIYCDIVDYARIISDLSPSETLTLQIFNYSDYENITFSIAEVPDNINCENAALLCQETVQGSNFGAIEGLYISSSDCFSYSGINNVLWYKLTTDNSGDPVSFEITKTKCTNRNDELYVSLMYDTCGGEYVEKACFELYQDGDKESIILDNPIPNHHYYLGIGTRNSSEYCNFEINVLEGFEYDCCQLDYSLDTWCYYLNTNNFFVDVTVNDLGQNPSGYQVEGTNKQITEVGTTTIGPIPNGTKTITLQGLDKTDCLITETIDFNCKECAEDLIHSNTTLSRNFDFNATKTIESAIQIMPSIAVKYSAGDSIILKQGFTVEKGADFSIDIEDCE